MKTPYDVGYELGRLRKKVGGIEAMAISTDEQGGSCELLLQFTCANVRLAEVSCVGSGAADRYSGGAMVSRDGWPVFNDFA